jgi:hypothetical protein
MGSLLVTPHFSITADEHRRQCRVIRSSVPLKAAEVQAAFVPVTRALATLACSQWRLLLDVCDAPMRNDDELERALDVEINAMARRFQKWAVLVKTSAGALQVNRVSRGGGNGEPTVFRSEDLALAWLEEP